MSKWLFFLRIHCCASKILYIQDEERTLSRYPPSPTGLHEIFLTVLWPITPILRKKTATTYTLNTKKDWILLAVRETYLKNNALLELEEPVESVQYRRYLLDTVLLEAIHQAIELIGGIVDQSKL